MDIENRKAEMLALLAELEADIQTLSDRITKAREDLANVHTLEEEQLFDESHDLEEGLKHILLF